MKRKRYTEKQWRSKVEFSNIEVQGDFEAPSERFNACIASVC